MGVTGLWSILQAGARPVKLETLAKKRIAVDASIWIYHFLKAVRDKEGAVLRNSHIVGFFRRICKLLFFGIKPVFVFDGQAPSLKRQTLRNRRDRREGRRGDAIKTAGKILAVQMRQRATEEAKRKRQNNDEVADVIPDQPVYFDQLQMTPQQLGSSKFKRTDQYHLPDLQIPLDHAGGANDPRIMSHEELQDYARDFDREKDMNLYDFSDIDFDGEFFTSLPAADQYSILNAARLRSRLRMGLSKDQLTEMFPDRLAFSKFQIERVKERSDLTNRLMIANGMNEAGAQRIASERGREYVLVKNDNVDGGYSLGVVNSAAKPILIDEELKEVSEVEDTDDLEFENVPIAETNFADEAPIGSLPTVEDELIMYALSQSRKVQGGRRSSPKDRNSSHVHTIAKMAPRATKDVALLSGIMPSRTQGTSEKAAQAVEPSLEATFEGGFIHDERNFDIDENADDIIAPPQSTFASTVPIVCSDPVLNLPRDVRRPQKSNQIKNTLPDVGPSTLPFPKLDFRNSLFFAAPDSIQTSLPLDSGITAAEELMSEEELPIVVAASQIIASLLSAKSETRQEILQQASADHSPGERGSDIAANAQRGSPPWFSEAVTTAPCDSFVNNSGRNIDDIPVKVDPERIQSLSAMKQQHVVDLTNESGDESPSLSTADLPMKNIANQTSRSASRRIESVKPLVNTTSLDGSANLAAVTLVNDTSSYMDDTAVESIQEGQTQRLRDSGETLRVVEGKLFTDLEDDSELLIDQEEEDLIVQMAEEEQEYARFSAQLANTENMNYSHEQYESDMKALKAEQRKNLRDADEVTQVMVQECQELLQQFGLPYITAPTEAEAQCAELVHLNLVDGIITDDSDVFLFGGTKIFKNMFNQAKTVECFILSDLEREFDLDRAKLINLAHLLGSDYTEGIPKVGPVTALELIGEFNGKQGLKDFKDWCDRVQTGSETIEDRASPFRNRFRKTAEKLILPETFPNPMVDEAYLKPEVEKDPSPFQWGTPDLDSLRSFLMRTIGWTPERTDEVLVPVIRDMNRKQIEGTQRNLTDFFHGGVGSGVFAPREKVAIGSARMLSALNALKAVGKRGAAAPSQSKKRTTSRDKRSKVRDTNKDTEVVGESDEDVADHANKVEKGRKKGPRDADEKERNKVGEIDARPNMLHKRPRLTRHAGESSSSDDDNESRVIGVNLQALHRNEDAAYSSSTPTTPTKRKTRRVKESGLQRYKSSKHI